MISFILHLEIHLPPSAFPSCLHASPSFLPFLSKPIQHSLTLRDCVKKSGYDPEWTLWLMVQKGHLTISLGHSVQELSGMWLMKAKHANEDKRKMWEYIQSTSIFVTGKADLSLIQNSFWGMRNKITTFIKMLKQLDPWNSETISLLIA